MKKAGRVARDTGHFSWALALFSEDYTTIRLRKCAAKAVLDYGFCGMSWLQDKDHPRGPSKCYIAGYVWQVCFFSPCMALAQTAVEGTVHDKSARVMPNASI